jgi:geranylgeranyl reductase family protein
MDATRAAGDAWSRRVIHCDALVAGGGPAGSTGARTLTRAGWNVIVIDRARFPRDKVCAGWLTPAVFRLLDLDPEDYETAGLTIQEIRGFRTGVIGGKLLDTRYASTVSYAIRRCEFDDFLLRRSGARIIDGTPLQTLRRDRDGWIVNDNIQARVIVGAGGHFCPVARHLRGGADTARPVIAKEAEFQLQRPHDGIDGAMPELFFCHDMEGYGWCVRKGNYLNVGIGRRTSQDFASHVRHFTDLLAQKHRLTEASVVQWRGHAYLAEGTGPRPLIDDGALIIGDAAGLAYPESGEGIRPAIESGRLAAETLIAAAGRTDRAALQPYAEALGRLHPSATRLPQPLRTATAAIGRILLGSQAFTRHVLLDRWFLRAQQ